MARRTEINGSNTPVEVRDLWQTQPCVFAYWKKPYNIKVDICATEQNALCDRFLTIKDDALQQDWAKVARQAGGAIWCNPPYSDILPWVEKAAEAADNGATTVMLLPNGYDTAWFELMEQTADKIFLMTGGRLSYIRADTGEIVNGNTRGSIFGLFRPDIHRPKALIKTIKKSQIMETGLKHINEMEKAS